MPFSSEGYLFPLNAICELQAEGILALNWNISVLCVNNSGDYLNPHHQGDSLSKPLTKYGGK